MDEQNMENIAGRMFNRFDGVLLLDMIHFLENKGKFLFLGKGECHELLTGRGEVGATVKIGDKWAHIIVKEMK